VVGVSGIGWDVGIGVPGISVNDSGVISSWTGVSAAGWLPVGRLQLSITSKIMTP